MTTTAQRVKQVTTIPATKTPGQTLTAGLARKCRVAAYARVSTEAEEQASSYEAQVTYYTAYIQGRAEWDFTGMYADEGITGTTTRHREGFKAMIADTLAGKIDLILTKSVSRFARNTVDTLTHVRQLKDAGVEVYFEKENIWTLDSKGELLITIMSSLAQEESRSISENVTWGHRKRFATGKIMVPYASLLGYKKGADGNLVVDENQAVIVRRIYARFLQGATPHTIASELTADAIPTPRGKTIWPASTIRSILTNEKYKGDALLQKTFTTDFLTKATKANEGEVPQYYVTANHEPIIAPSTWEAVQAELARRSGKGTANTHPFASRIQCAQCGGWYGRKVWHSTSKYRRYIWRCNNKYARKTPGTTPHVTDTQIREAFVTALDERVNDHHALDKTLRLLDQAVYDTTKLETRQAEITERIEETITLINQLVTTCTTTTHDPDDYDRRYQQLEQDHQKLARQIDDLRQRRAQAAKVHAFLSSQPPLDYSDHAWNTLIDHATITTNGNIHIHFKA